MKALIIFLITGPLVLVCFNNCIHMRTSESRVERDSRVPTSVGKDVQDLYNRFVENNFYDQTLGENDTYATFVNNFNRSPAAASVGGDNPDWIDAFIGSLPERMRRHYTFVHRSYSIQSGTPMAPRTLLFSPSARTIMTFNSPTDHEGNTLEEATGTQSVEVLQWNTDKLGWEFAELKWDGSQISTEVNPKRCVMCHAGTPKPVLASHAPYHEFKLKPIFPQYPLWPGFYGAVNDIIGVPKSVDASSRDTIMATEKDTRKHINGFLFEDSEELSRLRKALDKNPKYMNVVREEMRIHHTYFFDFIASMPERSRYRHLIPLTDLYEEGQTPGFLRS
ncbi:MAG: hypothetical protein AAF202_12190, partial [Pseudomonadota bacterium]